MRALIPRQHRQMGRKGDISKLQRTKPQYTLKQLAGALFEVHQKRLKVKAASRAFGVPRTSLGNHLRRMTAEAFDPKTLEEIEAWVNTDRGRPTLLDPALERMLVERVLYLADHGRPITRRHF